MLIRDNGLFADSYLPVADLDPRVANAALEALRDAGIAAYAKASPGVHGPYLDLHLPSRPSDRLFVDSTAATTARSVLADVLPNEYGGWVPTAEGAEGTQVPAELVGAGSARSGADPDLDTAWEQIVAGYDAAPPADSVPSWPAEEDLAEPATGDEEESDASGGWRGRVIRRVDVGDGVPADGQDADERAAEPTAGRSGSDEGHYVPPPPPPLPEVEPVTRFAWIGLLGGPGFLFVAALLSWELTGPVALIAIGAFLAGFVTLVARMKDRPPTDMGGDDGAVI